MIENYLDEQAIEEGLYDLYIAICQRDGTQTSIKDYIIWKEENYE